MRGLYNIILIHYGGVSVDGWLRTKKTPGQRFGAVSGEGGCRGPRAKAEGSRGGGEGPKSRRMRRRRRRVVLRNLGRQYNTILYVYKNRIIPYPIHI